MTWKSDRAVMHGIRSIFPCFVCASLSSSTPLLLLSLPSCVKTAREAPGIVGKIRTEPACLSGRSADLFSCNAVVAPRAGAAGNRAPGRGVTEPHTLQRLRGRVRQNWRGGQGAGSARADADVRRSCAHAGPRNVRWAFITPPSGDFSFLPVCAAAICYLGWCRC